MERKVGKFVYWTPRILSMIFILFLALMSLDVFELNLGFWQTAGALFLHNIPTLILLAALLISWRYEIVGGIAFILFGILYIFTLVRSVDNWGMALAWFFQISGIAFVIGGLFIANWIKKRTK